jgi:nitroreductase
LIWINVGRANTQYKVYATVSRMEFFAGSGAMDLGTAITGRRAVRDYTNQVVEASTIRRLIDAAVHAPSAVNQQPWTFSVVRDQDVLDRISLDAKSYMRANVPTGPIAEHLLTRLRDPSFHIFYHAPVLILISADAQGPWIVEDCALAAENLMLTAYAVGLGSCWIGFAQGFLNTPEGKAALGLPAGCVPVAPIIIGHPKAPTPPVARKAPRIHWTGS